MQRTGKFGSKIKIGMGVFLAAILFIGGCSSNMESAGNTESISKESSMNLEKHTQNFLPVIPAMDAAAPAVLETAYFGLG